MADSKGEWRWWNTVAIMGIVVVMILFGRFASPLRSWIACMVLLTAFLVVAGVGTTGNVLGALIDERNKMSLSRFQLLLWTVIILSAILAAAFSNAVAGNPGPLDLGIPQQLWLLMGISTTSLVGSPLIKSTKTDQKPQETEKEKTINTLASQQAIDPAKVDSKGQIIVNKDPDDARVADLFKGEETGNAANLDLAKVQMFFFTLILSVAYSAILYQMFRHDDRSVGIHAFPMMDQSMIALLGISHAGYLANKAVPHSTGATT